MMKFLIDLFPLVAFLMAYRWYGMMGATVALMVTTGMQGIILKIAYKRIDPIQRYTILGVLGFGSLTLLLNDQVYIMWKPSVIFGALALLIGLSSKVGKRVYFSARLLSKSINLSNHTWRMLDWMWLVFFLVLALINIYIVLDYMHITEKIAQQAIHCTTDQAVDLLCKQAILAQDSWVYFKTVWTPIGSLIFSTLQVIYIYRQVKQLNLT